MTIMMTNTIIMIIIQFNAWAGHNYYYDANDNGNDDDDNYDDKYDNYDDKYDNSDDYSV